MRHVLPIALALAAGLATSAGAQQFQETPGVLPPIVRWSEGVECADVDGDGDLDLLIADGEGFAGAGTPRQNGLWVNLLVETGSLAFADESVARLGAHVSNAKGVTTGDVNGDGWVDLLYSNAFNTAPPHLYVNRGATQPGFFDLDSAARGFTQPSNSAAAQFGDLDGDGDLDVLMCESGPSFLFGPGGRPRLYFNDGAGFFTEDPAALGASVKIGHMDVQLADVDGDWDLDAFVFNRANSLGPTHYLFLNDGTGQFSESSATVPNTSQFVYEAEVGDLDGDLDPDIFYTSLAGFQEGYQENRFVPTGVLSFLAGASLPPGVDDNEIALFDYDMDGDRDVLVGSLGNRERLYRNDGGLVFVPDDARIQAVSDPTLDLAVGDLDGDGDYDVVTVQGEGGSWLNRLYLNSGPADTLAPIVTALDFPLTVTTWPFVARAKVQDQVQDDGVSYVSARAAFTPLGALTHNVDHSGGAFVPVVLNIVVGDGVIFANADPATQTVTSTTAPYPYDYSLAQGQMVQHFFVSPGTYTYRSTASGATGTVNVTGSAGSAEGTHVGGSIFRFALPPQPGNFAFELFFEDGAGNVSATRSRGLPVATPGMSFCSPAVPNSSGGPAYVYATGSPVASANALTLNALGLPLDQFGYFLASRTQGSFQPPISQGTLCLSGNIGRFRASILNSGPVGAFELPIDLTAIPVNPPVAAAAGESWSFQAWFRDRNPTPTSNFTDGVEVVFQ